MIAASPRVTGAAGSWEQRIAREWLARESVDHGTPVDPAIAGERMLSRLHDHLAGVLGPDGSHAVFARALDRARLDQPLLADVRIPLLAGERIIQAVAPRRPEDQTAITEACIALMTGVLALLTRLIGADMVDRIIEQAWPDHVLDTKGTTHAAKAQSNNRGQKHGD